LDLAILPLAARRYPRRVGREVNGKPTILILILADLATDYRCRKLVASLARRGYHPVVLADRPLRAMGPAWDGVTVRFLTRQSHFRGFVRAWAEYLIRVTPILLADRSAAWIVADGTPLFWAALLGRLRGKRVVYDARELLLETPTIRDRWTRRLAWGAWLKLGEALCGPLLTVSPGLQAAYRAAHPGRAVHLLPNAPELKPAPPARTLGAGPVRLLFQGALRVGTGLGDLLPALALAPRYELDVYGDGAEAAALKASAAALGLGERVRFHGSVPFEALARPLAECHIGIHLMPAACRNTEYAWSNKLFDYVHALAPSLLGDTAGNRDFLAGQRVGKISASRAPEALVASLDALCADYLGYVDACRAARERWHWEGFAACLDLALGTGADRRIPS
jgi:glycosyltransferase involved in cell wall biosynthesis